VDFRESARSGNTGVTATVIQMLTGAAGSSGFKGIAGRFSRAGLQRHAPELPMMARYTRLDNGMAVDATADVSLVPASAELRDLLARFERGHVDDASLPELGRLWQEHVATLLLDRASDPAVFLVRSVDRRRDESSFRPTQHAPGSAVDGRQPSKRLRPLSSRSIDTIDRKREIE
jgi:hypothetical protein